MNWGEEKQVWSHAEFMVRALFAAGHKRVVVDACLLTRQARERWRGGWRVEIICFRTPEEECVRRAIKSGQKELVPIIRRMMANAQWPTEDEADSVTDYPIGG